MVQEVEKQTLEHGGALIAEIAELRATEVPERQRAAEVFAKAEKKWKDAKAKLQEAEKEYHKAWSANQGVSYHFDKEITQREQALRQTASPHIDAFLADLRRLEDNLRHNGFCNVIGTRTNPYTGQKRYSYNSNMGTTKAALAACREAREAEEALKLEALSEEDVLT